jgi:hypothetical protein
MSLPSNFFPPPRYNVPIFNPLFFIYTRFASLVLANVFLGVNSFQNVVRLLGGFGLYVYDTTGAFFTSIIQAGVDIVMTNTASNGEFVWGATDSLGGAATMTLSATAGQSYLTVDNLTVNNIFTASGAVITVFCGYNDSSNGGGNDYFLTPAFTTLGWENYGVGLYRIRLNAVGSRRFRCMTMTASIADHTSLKELLITPQVAYTGTFPNYTQAFLYVNTYSSGGGGGGGTASPHPFNYTVSCALTT